MWELGIPLPRNMEQALVRGILDAIEGAKLQDEEISREDGDAESRAHDVAIEGMRFRKDEGLTYDEVMRRGLEAVEM